MEKAHAYFIGVSTYLGSDWEGKGRAQDEGRQHWKRLTRFFTLLKNAYEKLSTAKLMVQVGCYAVGTSWFYTCRLRKYL